MTFLLESPFLQFTLNPNNSSWSLTDTQADGPSLDDVWMRVIYQRQLNSRFPLGKGRFVFLERWSNAHVSEVQQVTSIHGPLRQFVVDVGPDSNGIHCQVIFQLSIDQPIFFWNLILENHGVRPIEVEKIEMLRAGFFPKRRVLPVPRRLSTLTKTKPSGYGAVRPNQQLGDLGFFSNGWQSWSFSGAYSAEDCYRSSRLGSFASQLWYAGGKAPRKTPGTFTSDMFGVIGDRKHRTGILVGFLSQKVHFGSLDAFIADRLYPALSLWADGDQAWLEPGAKIATDWAVIQFVDLDDPDPLEPYLSVVARQHRLSSSMINSQPQIGWCSWYQYFNDIDESVIRSNLVFAENHQNVLPLTLFQIDDGFEAQVGDWVNFSKGFPKGVAPLAEEIRDAGFMPGLWLAPFILHSRSKTARAYRHWLLRNRFGIPVNAGFLWNNFTNALDLTSPEVLAHIRKLIHTAVHEWGFNYLKLDFLYAASLKGKYHDRTKTRAQVLRQGLETIREAAGPDAVLLGCGVPLGPSIDIFNAMRIGADVGPYWEPHLFPPHILFRHEPNIPSTRNALQNIISRSLFHHRWWINDPDCLILRADSHLTLTELQTLATAIAMTGGSLLLSDDLTKLKKERIRIAEQLLPLIDKRPSVVDWFDSATPSLLRLDLENQTGKWHLLAIFNWSSNERNIPCSLDKFGIPSGSYFYREFWSGDYFRISNGRFTMTKIPRHGVKLVALTPTSHNKNQDGNDIPCYLGSDLHISQGLEVTKWAVSPHGQLSLRLEKPGKFQGIFDLYLPEKPKKVSVESGEIQWLKTEDNLYRCKVYLDRFTNIFIT